jgi:hypothetical protein
LKAIEGMLTQRLNPYSQNTKLKLRSVRHLWEDLLALADEHPLDCPSIAA